jgi:histidine triad (HIT) family protein
MTDDHALTMNLLQETMTMAAPPARFGLDAARLWLLPASDSEEMPMPYIYDDQNIFAKILRGEIPNKTVLETEHTLAFHDIGPQAPVHVLVIPKGEYVNYDHFGAEASDAEIADFTRTLARLCADLDVAPGDGQSGYRLIANSGEAGVQEVPHMHVHILGGRGLGRMLAREG